LHPEIKKELHWVEVCENYIKINVVEDAVNSYANHPEHSDEEGKKKSASYYSDFPDFVAFFDTIFFDNAKKQNESKGGKRQS